MKNLMLGSMLVLICLPFPGMADIYKYKDTRGNVIFTDTPYKGRDYRLEWKRQTQKVVSESKTFVAMGRRVRTLAPAIKGTKLTAGRNRYANLIETAARRYDLYPELLHAVIRAESAYNPGAISPAGASGLMQLMPETAARYRVSDIFDPEQNIRGGAQYLRFLLDKFQHDLRLALAGYNAGENAVVKYGNKIPPYPETQQYVRKVLQFLSAERAYAGS